jgi:predicted transcriptional regulator
MLSLELRLKILTAISQNPKSMSKLARGMSNYCHIFNIIKGMEKKKLVTIVKFGKESQVRLTKSGFELLEHLNSIKAYFDILETDCR